ncbi:hypothetical protein sscle_06g055320 [Sclerotinia sclerotiorum 1980 UF-70]|uniref:Uncharacterized protein n=1 Tax=Sclerotinia sclerotiorum (strain ATCC 18683 / 1980 / Ss-1) TaxID=665079 RepID=A0A1D9Q7I3_SCLS1|nr:hypothetical protein sscle_06g055320 [Sclerotinia sclerotiorum 1980 UF-70]
MKEGGVDLDALKLEDFVRQPKAKEADQSGIEAEGEGNDNEKEGEEEGDDKGKGDNKEDEDYEEDDEGKKGDEEIVGDEIVSAKASLNVDEPGEVMGSQPSDLSYPLDDESRERPMSSEPENDHLELAEGCIERMARMDQMYPTSSIEKERTPS